MPTSRIAVAGFQHETNTFAAQKAELSAFEEADAWPPLVAGDELIPALTGINLPATGFIEAARARGHRIVPLLWCSATPSAPVTRAAFETICGQLLARLEQVLPVDALYLDLHGAMVAEHLDDAEGELLLRVRSLVGPELPVVASLDLHANVSATMVRAASALVAYRTYPHVDMASTGARAAALLDRLLSGIRMHAAFRRLPFLIPLASQHTGSEPMGGLMKLAEGMETAGVETVSLVPGFPMADIADCGPVVIAWGQDPQHTQTAVDRIAAAVTAREGAFDTRLLAPAQAIAEAERILRHSPSGHPVILADTQDNSGAGGSADSTAVLKALVDAGTQGATLGLLCDPRAADQAHQSGVGSEIRVELGGHSGVPGDSPWCGIARVVALGDGHITATGPFYAGARMELGPMALLDADGVQVAVSTRKQQAADQAMFRHLGVEPGRQRLLVLKSSVHFRADFEPIAAQVLMVKAPGRAIADPAELPFRRLRAGVRLGPLGPPFLPDSSSG